MAAGQPPGLTKDHPRQANTGPLAREAAKHHPQGHGHSKGCWQGNRATQLTQTVNPGKHKWQRQTSRPRPGGTRRHPPHHNRRQAPTKHGREHHPRGTPAEQANRPPTTATSGPQQENTGRHTRRTHSPPQPATGRHQEGREATPNRPTTTRRGLPPRPQPAPAHIQERQRPTPTSAPPRTAADPPPP